MNDNDHFISAPVTIKEALIKNFTDDWNSRKVVENGEPGDVLCVSITYNAKIPMELAKKIYKEFKAGV